MKLSIEGWTIVVPDHVYFRAFLTPDQNGVLVQFQGTNAVFIESDHGKLRCVVESVSVLEIDESGRTIEVQQRDPY